MGGKAAKRHPSKFKIGAKVLCKRVPQQEGTVLSRHFQKTMGRYEYHVHFANSVDGTPLTYTLMEYELYTWEDLAARTLSL